jgi:hypothetical protein
MNSGQFRSILNRLGLSQLEAARIFGIGERTARRLSVCAPAPVTRLPGSAPGTCFAGPHFPWSPPLRSAASAAASDPPKSVSRCAVKARPETRFACASVGGAAHRSASSPRPRRPAGRAKSDTRTIELRDAFDTVRRRLRRSRRKTVLAEIAPASWPGRTPCNNQGTARYKPVVMAFPPHVCAEKARQEDGERQ